MGNRLTKIYTRTGDEGTTGLAIGGRVDKDSARIAAIGDCDELNCVIGLALTHDVADPIRSSLQRVQNELFDVGGELAMPGETVIRDVYVDDLEADLDAINDTLPPLKEFILPGGAAAAATLHLARATCRRLERNVWHLHRQEPLSAVTLRYINRLSDYLFVAARAVARSADEPEVFWSKRD